MVAEKAGGLAIVRNRGEKEKERESERKKKEQRKRNKNRRPAGGGRERFFNFVNDCTSVLRKRGVKPGLSVSIWAR